LGIGDRERMEGLDEEEVEGQEGRDRRDDRGPAPKRHGDGEHGDEVEHGDVGDRHAAEHQRDEYAHQRHAAQRDAVAEPAGPGQPGSAPLPPHASCSILACHRLPTPGYRAWNDTTMYLLYRLSRPVVLPV